MPKHHTAEIKREGVPGQGDCRRFPGECSIWRGRWTSRLRKQNEQKVIKCRGTWFKGLRFYCYWDQITSSGRKKAWKGTLAQLGRSLNPWFRSGTRFTRCWWSIKRFCLEWIRVRHDLGYMFMLILPMRDMECQIWTTIWNGDQVRGRIWGRLWLRVW